jgi:DNA-binding LacI/PurR family transcriptional regulator
MPVTQQHIADHLGLSKMSVVRALTGQTKVSEATRRLVLETAKEMGYHQDSNPEARMLAARRYGNRVRHGVVGLFVSRQQGQAFPYYAHLLDGMRQGAQTMRVELMLLDTPSSPAWSKVDGVIGHADNVNLPPDHPLYSMPRVSMMAALEGVPSIAADDFGGAKAATEYLIGLGHRRIAYLIDTFPGIAQVEQRLGGYQEALRAAGIVAEESWIGPLHSAGAQFLARGRDSMKRWLDSGWHDLGCTALLVHNDRAAMGAMEALYSAGIRVPEDVSVIGFDSTEECDLVRPTLTSVRVPLEEIGSRAVELLHDSINEKSASTANIVLPATLEIRNSTAPPRN